jgi:hypothetical protein
LLERLPPPHARVVAAGKQAVGKPAADPEPRVAVVRDLEEVERCELRDRQAACDDSLAPAIRSIDAEPRSRNRPVPRPARRPRSMMPAQDREEVLGTRCTSSRTTSSSACASKKSSGSASRARSDGASRSIA